MCDYSLHHVSSRPAQVADKLVTMEVARSKARGFAAVGELGTKLVVHDDAPQVAVCLLPGTELAFDDAVRYDRAFSLRLFGATVFGEVRVDHKVASFRQVDLNDPYVQHDALEFPDGQVVKINRLVPGQTATVLQLPVVAPHNDHDEHVGARSVARSRDSHFVLDRVSIGSGIASILVPNQGSAMLWNTFRTAAIDLGAALAQAFRRATARKPDLVAELPDTGSHNSMPVVALPQKLANPMSDKKTEARSAAELPSA